MAHDAHTYIPSNDVSQSFAVARATAISSYSSVEVSLANLFAYLMGVPQDFSGVSFFRINSAHSRNMILGRLLKKRHANKYNLFWNSMERHLQTLSGERNQVVHWAVTSTINVDVQPGGAVTGVKLIPPNFWDRDANSPEMTIENLYDFIVKAQFLSRVLNVFHWTISESFPVDQTWHDICLEPVIYPPSDTHPLSLKQSDS